MKSVKYNVAIMFSSSSEILHAAVWPVIAGNTVTAVKFSGLTRINEAVRHQICYITAGLGVTGGVILSLLQKPRGSMNTNERTSPREALKTTFTSLKKKKISVLFLMFCYVGFQQGFGWSIYASCIGFTNQFGDTAIELVAITSIIVNGFGGFSSLQLGRKQVLDSTVINRLTSFPNTSSLPCSSWCEAKMKSLVYLTVILATGVLSGALDSQIGDVGSLVRFEFHNKTSGTEVLAAVEVEDELTYEDVEQFLTNFNASKETKILVHGWLNNDKQPFADLLIGNYLAANDYNVIFVDWSAEAFQFYPRAVQAVPKVARIVAQLIDVLVQNCTASKDDIHIVGHSLGAHIAGIAGLYVESGQIARVTGLDPAKPLYHMSTVERLRPLSAKFVDVIHTCSNYLSFIEPIGHVDFYPNAGLAIQPGCGFGDMIAGVCSHSRSYKYFAESIEYPENFVATQCDCWDSYKQGLCVTNSTALMGESVPTSAQGTYYLGTNGASPFGQGNN